MKPFVPTRVLPLLLVLLVHGMPPQVGAQVRTWTSVTRETLEGEFISATATAVTIRRADGRRLTVPLSKLSGADGQWVARKLAQQKRPAGSAAQIWGKNAALWNPEDETLLDFSYAGYHRGRNDFPGWPKGVSVRDFGAKGDGQTDDTAAFASAIEACPANHVVFIPNGTYKLMDWVGVDKMVDKWVKPKPKSHIALCGENRDKTVLLLGIGLHEIHPWDTTTGSGRPTTQWSWSGGFLWFQDCKEVGVENLTIKGNGKQYEGHWKERGFNGIFFRNVEDAWVREVTFVNVECGIQTNNSKQITIADVLFQSTPQWPHTSQFEDNYGISGHHAIIFGQGSSWCLADNVVFENRFHHELGLNRETHHCVYSNVSGPNLHFDFHTDEDNIHHILFTEIDAGEGDLIWRNNFYGACSGAVLWNIKGKNLSLPQVKSWVKHPVLVEDLKTLLAGWPIDLPDLRQRGRPWFEEIAPEMIEPQNIYHAQREKRLAPRARR